MEIATSILLLIANLWASLTAKTSAFSNINERRDIILTGKIDGVDISLEHRRLILESDWHPLAWGATLTGLLFGAVAVLIPYLIPDTLDRRPIALVCWAVAAYQLIAAAVTLLNLFKERRFLRDYLDRVERAKGVS